MTPDIDAWAPWRPREVAARLDGVGAPWCVAGGWAIDLHLGVPTRSHSDLELAVPSSCFPLISARFPELTFYVAGDGAVAPVTPAGLNAHFQTWAYDEPAGVWRFDVMREPHDGEVWISRRDARLRRQYSSLIRRSADGIPYLSPEVVLLFKAKHLREKDLADYAAVAPVLNGAERDWLDHALGLAHPGHPWQRSSRTSRSQPYRSS